MKLKGLSLKGFKSFADRTEIECPEGITMIVGPNGSGKSNISDALRWVFGETSWKSLRGERMEDVIYQGAKNRNPLSFAEVEAIIDNSDGFLAVDCKEVSISRKLYRSGESVFMLNRKECRAKDIRNIFLDTGVGRDGYSIIGQGKIDEILSTRPDERRAIFEEVAGIAKYRSRKIEAEKKLIRTVDNLVRIEDIENELKNSLASVSEEAEKTRRYQQAFEEYKNLDLILSSKEYRAFLKKKDEINSNLRIGEAEVLKKEEDSFQFQKDLSDKKNSLDLVKKKEKTFAEERESLNFKEAELSKEISIKENTLSFYYRERERLGEEIEKHKAEILRLENESKVFSEAIEGIKRNILSEEDAHLKTSKVLSEISPAVEKRLKEGEFLRDGLIKVVKRLESVNEKLIFSTSSLTELCGKKDKLEKNISEFKEKIELKEISGSELRKKTALIKREIENEKKVYSDFLKKKELAQSDINNALNERHKIELAIEGLKSELSIISKLEENFEGYKRPVKFIMSLKNHGKMGVIGTVSELFTNNESFSLALETALGVQLQSIVVEKEMDAKTLIELLKSKREGRITFLPLNRIVPSSQKIRPELLEHKGVFGSADTLINYDEKYKNVFSNLLGRTLVVDHLKTAFSLNKDDIKFLRVITLEGEVLSSGGAITGGYEGESRTGLIRRKNKMTELSERIKQKELELSESYEKFSIKNSLLGELEKNLYESSLKGERLTKDNDKDLREEERIEVELTSLKEFLRRDEEEFSSLKETIVNTEKEIVRLKAEKDDLTAEEKNLSRDLEAIHTSTGAETERIKLLKDEQGESRIKLENMKSRLERLKEKSILNSQGFFNETEELNKKLAALGEQEQTINNSLTEIEKKRDLLKKIEVEVSEKDKTYQELRKSSENLLEEIYEIQKKIEENAEFRSMYEKKFSDLKVKEKGAELSAEHLRDRIFSSYEIDIESIPECEKETKKTSTEKMEALKAEMLSLGEINPLALQEEEKLSERLGLLGTQKEDLLLGKSDLEKLILEIENKMSVDFTNTLKDVDRNFNSIFQKFFGGGTANIFLTDKENPLTSGVEIPVTLPSKRKQSISLLSGGEKALTAIALLFAIQKIKPSPFCILDEIDAALDDANIERFTKYLTDSLDNVQFILVTHRKKTMEAANTIYGVTMDNDGTSRLFSMKLENLKEG